MPRLFTDLGFRWKITLPIAALALLLVLMGVFGMRGIERVIDCLGAVEGPRTPHLSHSRTPRQNRFLY